MADRYWVGGTGNWDGAGTTHWSASSGGASGASVPTSSDNVVFDSASNATAYTVTITATANCRDLTFANPPSGVVTFAGASDLNVAGSLTMATGMTRTYTGTISLTATTSGKTLTCNGVEFGGIVAFTGASGGWTFQDTFTSTDRLSFTAVSGTLNFGNQNVTATTLGGNTGTKTVTLGSGLFTMTGIGSLFDFGVASGLVITATTGTLRISNTSASNKILEGKAGLVFGVLDVTTGGSGVVQLRNNFTFTRITATGGGTKTITLPGSGTITLTGTTPLPSGAPGNLLTFAPPAGSATVALSNQAAIDYVSLTNIVASGVTPAYAGTHSTDGGGNTNWLFTDPPSGGNDPVTSVFAPLLLLK